ncbi:hypothetical protein PCH_Pc22g26030 [Penicillium rubens Wisconsin 54-1255]|uniref:Uncharacterized protein n=1 Tax=Penicillium rubens (strain ATCC 28089 / DSM 1075 / NRRL 1951 / Wisconsin 54-1255) TaxID=500485 RepID=B6HTD0_PENRW|nr:hypothetical protein PCH_Pc22g26030 [Penicillium rubens Wisconsin 54-1255]
MSMRVSLHQPTQCLAPGSTVSEMRKGGFSYTYRKPLTAHQGESEPAPPSVLRAKPAYTPFLVLPLACPLWNIATQGCGPKTGRISSERSFFMVRDTTSRSIPSSALVLTAFAP